MLYHLNQSSAESIIKDAMEQDFKGKDLFRYFLAVISLFGWGSSEQFDFDPETGCGTIIITHFPKLSIAQSEPIHDDFAGIIARALELSFSGKYDVIETKCCEMTTEGQECSYQIKPAAEGYQGMESKVEVQHIDRLDTKTMKNPEEFDKFVTQFSMPEDGILLLGENDELKRIVIKDVASINSMFLKTADLIGWKTIGSVCFRVGRDHVLKELKGKDRIDIEFIQDYLKKLTLFGWGFFDLQTGEGKYHVVLWNNPFTSGFPMQQFSTDYLVGGIICGLFEILKKTRVSVKELECTAKGDSRCLFEVRDQR